MSTNEGPAQTAGPPKTSRRQATESPLSLADVGAAIRWPGKDRTRRPVVTDRGLRARETSRRARVRRDAGRALDELLVGPLPPLVLVDRGGDYWHDTWSDRGVPERDRRGRELAGAGWTP